MMKSTLASTLPLVCCLFSFTVMAQGDRTGSHLDVDSSNSLVLDFVPPDEVGVIRVLIQEGRKAEALRRARRFVRETDVETGPEDKLKRYYAYNTLCTALTNSKQLDEAISACTRAMALRPDQWSAVNNRGTARFMAGDYREALSDYQAALTLAPEHEGVIATIEHNIRLCRERMQEN